MSLTLSSRELALLGNALTITSAPLAYERTSEWLAAVRQAIEPLLGADRSASGLGIDGEPFIEAPAEDLPAWNVYVASGFADERGDRRIGRRGPEVANVAMVHDVPGLRRSELYNEFVLPYRMFHPVSIQLVIAGSPAPALISFFRTSESAPPLDDRAVAILELVRPVFRASAELLTSLGRRPCTPALSELVDTLPEAAAICASSGRVLHESPSLARLIADEPLAARVRIAIVAAARALGGHVARAGKPDRQGPGSASAFEVAGARARYAVRASLLTFAPALARDGMTIVFVSVAAPYVQSDVELRERFGFTRREIDVVRLLAVGRSAREIADTLGISYYTARHHVEHVLEKLGVRTRAAVAAAITALRDD